MSGTISAAMGRSDLCWAGVMQPVLPRGDRGKAGPWAGASYGCRQAVNKDALSR
jgi:hypothetical protein